MAKRRSFAPTPRTEELFFAGIGLLFLIIVILSEA